MITKLFSILLAFSVVGGAVYLAQKADKMPVLNKVQTENFGIKTGGNVSLGHRDVSHLVIDEPVSATSVHASDGAVVKCVEGGNVTYSNTGCRNGVIAKVVEMNHAAGIVSPSREVVNVTVQRMFSERAAENQRLEETARQPKEAHYHTQAGIDQCKRLHDRNNDIDRESNQALTAFQQAKLLDEKNENIKRQYDLHC